MLLGAQYIKKRLDDVGILDRAFNLYPNYSLILTGKSFLLFELKLNGIIIYKICLC